VKTFGEISSEPVFVNVYGAQESVPGLHIHLQIQALARHLTFFAACCFLPILLLNSLNSYLSIFLLAPIFFSKK
jgi:hypothetical protein